MGSSEDREPFLDRRALLVILGAAAGAGIYLEATRDRAPRTPASTPAVAAPTAPGAPPTAPAGPTRAAAQAALRRLEGVLRGPSADERIPWAVAHGLLAFGASFAASSGRPAVEVLAAHATRDSEGRWAFPTQVGGEPMDAHRHLVLAKLLEAGVGLDRTVSAAGGERTTLGALVTDAVSGTSTGGDTDWRNAAFAFYVLARAGALVPAPRVAEARSAALARAERELLPIREAAAGPAEHAFDLGMPLRAAKEGRRDVYAHPCGGLHFIGGTLALVAAGGDAAERERAARLLEDLAFRWRAERRLYARSLEQYPHRRLELLVQQLKFHGHLLEVLGEARTAGLAPRGIAVDDLSRGVAADVLAAVDALDRDGAWGRLDDLRASQKQAYLDLVGDGCHAVRGLRLAAEHLP